MSENLLDKSEVFPRVPVAGEGTFRQQLVQLYNENFKVAFCVEDFLGLSDLEGRGIDERQLFEHLEVFRCHMNSYVWRSFEYFSKFAPTRLPTLENNFDGYAEAFLAELSKMQAPGFILQLVRAFFAYEVESVFWEKNFVRCGDSYVKQMVGFVGRILQSTLAGFDRDLQVGAIRIMERGRVFDVEE